MVGALEGALAAVGVVVALVAFGIVASVLEDLWLRLLPVRRPLTIDDFPGRIGGLPLVVLAESETYAGYGHLDRAAVAAAATAHEVEEGDPDEPWEPEQVWWEWVVTVREPTARRESRWRTVAGPDVAHAWPLTMVG